jgi:hypothetical protein
VTGLAPASTTEPVPIELLPWHFIYSYYYWWLLHKVHFVRVKPR